jgi:hypothetical protein
MSIGIRFMEGLLKKNFYPIIPWMFIEENPADPLKLFIHPENGVLTKPWRAVNISICFIALSR